MSGAEDEDQIDSAFYPGFKRRVKTETEESPESYQAMLQQMQDRMGKMEEKYETEMAEMAMENDAQARIIQKLQAKIGTTKHENGTTAKTTKDELLRKMATKRTMTKATCVMKTAIMKRTMRAIMKTMMKAH